MTVFVYLVFGQLRASKVIHKNLIESVLSAPLRQVHIPFLSFFCDGLHDFPLQFRWLDVTPTSRIIARVTNDVRAVDDSLANQFWPLTTMIVSMMVRVHSALTNFAERIIQVKFAAVVIYTPIFFFPGALVGALGAWVGQIYIAGQLPVKRLMSNTRAPVLAQYVFSGALGLFVSSYFLKFRCRYRWIRYSFTTI
jgi:ABC-type multidrug transport system fused ATPase/permease subunit